MTQMIKKHWSLLLLAAAIIFAAASFVSKKSNGNKVHLSIKTFAVDNGWGYDILTNDSIYIHQQFIPAVQGNKPFASKEQAEKVGRLIVEKMKGKQSPTISLQELDSCKVQY